MKLQETPWYRPNLTFLCNFCFDKIAPDEEIYLTGFVKQNAKTAIMMHNSCMEAISGAGMDMDGLVQAKYGDSPVDDYLAGNLVGKVANAKKAERIKIDILDKSGKVVGCKDISKDEWHQARYACTPLDQIPNSLEEWCKNGNEASSDSRD